MYNCYHDFHSLSHIGDYRHSYMKDCPNGQHIEMVITGAMLELGRSPVLTAGAVAPDITCYAPVITCSAPAITYTYTMHQL